MRLDPTSNSGIDVARPKPVQPGSEPATDGTRRSGDSDSSFERTSELEGLIRAVSELPEVREDAVAAAGRKLQSGELTTPEAARETAASLVDDLSATE